MDKRQEAINVIKALHNFQDNIVTDAELIKQVCNYYDFVKDTKLSQADLEFLKKIANVVGIPHYFDHLKIFQSKIYFKDISLNALSSKIYESTLHTTEDNKIHRYQQAILSKYVPNKQNRYFLSASTSFGKTHLVYEIIRKMKYRNIFLIFPTIALLSENLEKLHSNPDYEEYKIHTLSDVPIENMQGKNIFIYTPERFLSFLEKCKINIEPNFIFIDEVYKIDNEYIIDEQTKENERDISYRLASYYSVIGYADILLAGPYIEKYSQSFEFFLNDNQITKLDFNQYEIVGKSFSEIKSSSTNVKVGKVQIDFHANEKGKYKRLKKIVPILSNDKNENCIIYCSNQSSAEEYANTVPQLISYKDTSDDYKYFIQHLIQEYGKDWIVPICLKKGVGIHHGLVPKYIQKEIISFFNNGIIKALASTTTITEGVNTSAKNVIITLNKKGNKTLKRFDAKNIAGRAGRFDRHYSGRVIVLQNKFMNDIKKDQEQIHHKNYDLQSQKDEIDLFYSDDRFLTSTDKARRDNIKLEQQKRDIPEEIINTFKIVCRTDKIKLYDRIQGLNSTQNQLIKILIQKINVPNKISIDWNGLQTILDCILPIVNPPLKSLLVNKTLKGTGDHSIIVPMLHNYLESGFKGLVKYKCEERGEDINLAIRNTARFIYNTAKYQLVKYLGVFNVMYKFHRSKTENIAFNQVSGIDKLLTKLEYNAFTELGRKISDYGVPAKVLQYYDNNKNVNIKNSFDTYEKSVFDNLEHIIHKL